MQPRHSAAPGLQVRGTTAGGPKAKCRGYTSIKTALAGAAALPFFGSGPEILGADFELADGEAGFAQELHGAGDQSAESKHPGGEGEDFQRTNQAQRVECFHGQPEQREQRGEGEGAHGEIKGAQGADEQLRALGGGVHFFQAALGFVRGKRLGAFQLAGQFARALGGDGQAVARTESHERRRIGQHGRGDDEGQGGEMADGRCVHGNGS